MNTEKILTNKKKIDLYNKLKNSYSGKLSAPNKCGYTLEFDPVNSKWDYIMGSYNHYVNSDLNKKHQIFLSKSGIIYEKLIYLDITLRAGDDFKFKDNTDTSKLTDHIIFPEIDGKGNNFGICYFPYSKEDLATKKLVINSSLLDKPEQYDFDKWLYLDKGDLNLKRFMINPNFIRYALEGVVGFLLCPVSLEDNLLKLNSRFKNITNEDAFFFLDNVEIKKDIF